MIMITEKPNFLKKSPTYYRIIMQYYQTQPRRPAKSKSRIIIHHLKESTSCVTSQIARKISNAKSSTALSHPPSPTAAQHPTWARQRTAPSMPSSPQANHQTRCTNCTTERKHQLATSTNSITTDVHIVPTIDSNSLLSTAKFATAGYITVFDGKEVNIYDQSNTKVVVTREAILRG